MFAEFLGNDEFVGSPCSVEAKDDWDVSPRYMSQHCFDRNGVSEYGTGDGQIGPNGGAAGKGVWENQH